MASSEDGMTWTRHGKELIEQKLGPTECQAGADVSFRNGRFHMFFSYRTIEGYKSKGGGYRLGYATSTDMLRWTRHDELAGLGPSDDGGWDSDMASYGHVFDLDDQSYMLYQGNGMGLTGIGLAKLANPQAW